MKNKVLAVAILTALSGVVVMSAPAEARHMRLWWLQDQSPEEFVPVYDDSSYADQQELDAEDMFNQAQYDLYMRQTGRKPRQNYSANYYDPQLDRKLPQHRMKKKPVQKFAAMQAPTKKSAVLAPKKPVQVASLSNRFGQKASAAKVDCGRGASIVAGYGFSAVTTKSCGGETLVYGATRSGKAFEIQVNSASGELTTVKRL